MDGEDAIPHDYLCAITLDIMGDPIRTSCCGKSCEKEAFKDAISRRPVCFWCASERASYADDRELKSEIERWRKRADTVTPNSDIAPRVKVWIPPTEPVLPLALMGSDHIGIIQSEWKSITEIVQERGSCVDSCQADSYNETLKTHVTILEILISEYTRVPEVQAFLSEAKEFTSKCLITGEEEPPTEEVLEKYLCSLLFRGPSTNRHLLQRVMYLCGKDTDYLVESARLAQRLAAKDKADPYRYFVLLCTGVNKNRISEFNPVLNHIMRLQGADEDAVLSLITHDTDPDVLMSFFVP